MICIRKRKTRIYFLNGNPGRNFSFSMHILSGLTIASLLFSHSTFSIESMGRVDAKEAISEASKNDSRRQYTYAWMFGEDDTMRPRGGTSKGPEVTLDSVPSSAFVGLQQAGLTAKERDRRAILAMAGDYRTSFDFIETVGFTPGYEPQRPYQSWGTERVYTVVEESDYISLQHIIVMHFLDDEGSLSDPMVVKHWRQDWRYEDREVHEFSGRQRWEKRRLPRGDARGAWTQTVYQVDDSPRYEAVGRWMHSAGVSVWESSPMRRPLPRREFSVRDDYQALYGSHRITIYPGGWTQEEDALKLVLDEQNQPVAEGPYLAREAGLSRYERIKDYDFSAGDEYWNKTRVFWAQVRAYWDSVFATQKAFGLEKSIDGVPMFMALFTLAESADMSPAEQRDLVRDAINPYLKP